MTFSSIYRNRKVLVTGHTGFKGSWLSLWLQSLGAKVYGISLPPDTTPSHWNLLKLDIESFYIDIRDQKLLNKKILDINPEIVFHLAAQPLVRRSYSMPVETWETNVMGTANVLNACRYADKLRAILVVTTDKCYENKEWAWGYREIDPLGGHDPYSSSKAASELVVSSFRQSFFQKANSPQIASARAGNVIGGGDWSEDRLIPDLVRSIQNQKPLDIRSPNATRPWQHVLDCLSGYMVLGQHLLDAGDKSFANAWNFGPDREGNRSVQQMLSQFKLQWPEACWQINEYHQVHEARLLHLDSSKAREKLRWAPVWSFDEGIAATTDWYKSWLYDEEIVSLRQLQAYCNQAKELRLSWAMDESEQP